MDSFAGAMPTPLSRGHLGSHAHLKDVGMAPESLGSSLFARLARSTYFCVGAIMIAGEVGAAVGPGDQSLGSAIFSGDVRIDVPLAVFNRLPPRVCLWQLLFAIAPEIQNLAAAFVPF